MFPDEKPKVPLSASWLSENGMLAKATEILGEPLIPKSEDSLGFQILTKIGPCFLEWDVSLRFTLAQLYELGFDLGDGTQIWHDMQ